MRQGFINMSAGFFVTRHAICRLFFRLSFLPHLQIFCQRASTQQKYSPAYLFAAERREQNKFWRLQAQKYIIRPWSFFKNIPAWEQRVAACKWDYRKMQQCRTLGFQCQRFVRSRVATVEICAPAKSSLVIQPPLSLCTGCKCSARREGVHALFLITFCTMCRWKQRRRRARLKIALV